MSDAYSGGCACGAIRYEIPGEPFFMNHCHCRDCQHKSGTGHGSYLTFAAAGVKLTGEATQWDMVADSGNVKTRGFCPRCGSPVYLRFSATPQIFTVHAASLDDPSRYKPQVVTYRMRALAWDQLDPELPAFDRCRRDERSRRDSPAFGARAFPTAGNDASQVLDHQFGLVPNRVLPRSCSSSASSRLRQIFQLVQASGCRCLPHCPRDHAIPSHAWSTSCSRAQHSVQALGLELDGAPLDACYSPDQRGQ